MGVISDLQASWQTLERHVLVYSEVKALQRNEEEETKEVPELIS